MRRHPHLLEVHALRWLRALGDARGEATTLEDVSEETLERLTDGFDALWLMGVWERSPAARQRALEHPDLRAAYDRALPGWREQDVHGSPYAVHRYVPDAQLGGVDALRDLQKRLHRLGKRLIVDFVPNHVALDHPWTTQHPEWLMGGDEASLERDPESYFRAPHGNVVAHGRDPYFPAWRDTAQVDFFHPGLRAAWIETLKSIAEVADGVRCDMAMLALNDVFASTWADALHRKRAQHPSDELWAEAIASAKSHRPGFIFIAEAYWELQPRLLELGFDFAYDKGLYDRLLHDDAEAVRRHIEATSGWSAHATRFLENHDEARASEAFGPTRARAAAVALATLPGMRMFHEGQMQGRRTHTPIQLLSPAEEADDDATRAWYGKLLPLMERPIFHTGEWRLLEARSRRVADGADDASVLAWAWHAPGLSSALVAINYSGHRTQTRIDVPPGLGRADAGWHDHLGGLKLPTQELVHIMRFELEAWQACVFQTAAPHEAMAF